MSAGSPTPSFVGPDASDLKSRLVALREKLGDAGGLDEFSAQGGITEMLMELDRAHPDLEWVARLVADYEKCLPGWLAAAAAGRSQGE